MIFFQRGQSFRFLEGGIKNFGFGGVSTDNRRRNILYRI